MSEPVPLTTAPNAPLAEVLCARLRSEGIPAFYECAAGWTPLGASTTLNPTLPAQVYVRAEDLERARHVIA